ncbi:hypothetical protein L9F63_000928, partial [Diploptera punctata]
LSRCMVFWEINKYGFFIYCNISPNILNACTDCLLVLIDTEEGTSSSDRLSTQRIVVKLKNFFYIITLQIL